MIELILTIFLERTTKKNSDNSSIPPSQTEKDNSSLTSPGSNSKGKRSDGEKVKNRRTHETVHTLIRPTLYRLDQADGL